MDSVWWDISKKCITQVPSLIIIEVIDQRLTRCSGQAQCYV